MGRYKPLSPNLDEHEVEGEGYGTDEGPAEPVRDRLIEEAGIDPVEVAVSVTGGVVMLDGLVDELDAREVLEQVALDVPGVRAVDDRLRRRRGPVED